MKQAIIFILFVLVAGIESFSQSSQVFKTNGKAIKGYDVVAFYTDGKPVQGQEKYVYSWRDANWLFSNQQHLDLFKAAPEKYAPQYGGYCAYGISDGHKAPTQTDTWTIVDGKLYFNYNNNVKEMWNKKTREYIQQANKNWVFIKEKE